MKTVKEVCTLSGVSARTLRHYDAIGLLRPAELTEAGYRLYDDAAIDRLGMILLYRELGFSLREIAGLLDAPDDERSRVLETQIDRMKEQRRKLQARIDLAIGMKAVGGKNMKRAGFDVRNIDEYDRQAKELYQGTDAYREYEQKAQNRSRAENQALGGDMMALFEKLGRLRECGASSPEAQAWAGELQTFITEHYYTCTNEILRGLGQMYAAGGSMTENIDRAGGPGTGEFARQIIEIYTEKAE